MTALRMASVVTVVCAALVSGWSVTSSFLNGVVQVGGSPWFEWLVVIPTIIGLPVALGAAVSVPFLWGRRRLTRAGDVVIALGQVLTITLAALAVFALNLPGATGWELLLLGPAFVVGQLIVAVGLARGILARRAPPVERPES
ncbi:hypothetical protein [Gordonia soli]|uniref:Uncharacterized protein n=1 Tax=Gordonia soli NBRC 108243 TaxID=1223545 RepID=M0QDZ5_9ACTN|nr:hypothetical protein [Gordonia soli]GAC66546.1 hypothetical protein GS4_02_02590 [Gordonia soli NBRC 108243]